MWQAAHELPLATGRFPASPWSTSRRKRPQRSHQIEAAASVEHVDDMGVGILGGAPGTRSSPGSWLWRLITWRGEHMLLLFASGSARILRMLAACLIVAAAMSAAAAPTPAVYDLVIVNGRVIDPASGLDAVRSIGVNGSTIQVVTEQPLTGRTHIDAAGLVVAPGFIDLHQHAQRGITPAVDRLKVMDGVTTAFELEVGTDDIDAWYAARVGKSILNYGVSIGHIPSRMAVMKDPAAFLPSGPAARRAATEGEIADISARISHGLDRGAVAVGFGFAYTPG